MCAAYKKSVYTLFGQTLAQKKLEKLWHTLITFTELNFIVFFVFFQIRKFAKLCITLLQKHAYTPFVFFHLRPGDEVAVLVTVIKINTLYTIFQFILLDKTEHLSFCLFYESYEAIFAVKMWTACVVELTYGSSPHYN